ncbi:MAG TPA: hypothetical protein GX707_05590 [Epulopiscium sp.]|nr:hypothetical protein [Candidatus Epulonipiscium sp.]
MGLITKKDFSEVKRFELNFNQLKILFSLQYLITREDAEETKDQKRFVKRQWMRSWSASIHDYLGGLDASHTRKFYTLSEIKQAVNMELMDTPSNRTWYPIVILEATSFIPYTILRRNKSDDKAYMKLRFTKQTNYIKRLVGERGIVKTEDVERFEEEYQKVCFQLKETKTKIRDIFVHRFAGVKGAALSSASLAAVAGGAIGVNETEEGSTVSIVGGGALLGLAIDQADIGIMDLLIVSFPEFTFLQAARLEVVVKEIILNKQQNVMLAKHILNDYAEQIKKVNNYIQDLKLEGEERENRKSIKDLEQSLRYMQKTYVNISKATAYAQNL